MNRISTTAAGTVKDLPGFRALVDEEIAIIENDLPGTLVFEMYLDEGASRFVARGSFEDSAAILKHLERVLAAGIIDRFPALVDFDLTVVLGEVSDEARAKLADLGFDFYAPLAQARG